MRAGRSILEEAEGTIVAFEWETPARQFDRVLAHLLHVPLRNPKEDQISKSERYAQCAGEIVLYRSSWKQRHPRWESAHEG